jgi:hypothetical protein
MPSEIAWSDSVDENNFLLCLSSTQRRL